uniref:Putative tail protein n=1 Tax=viral metagenome TaxID=1070528 RepID=A0A6M3IJD8_9ZZZZ
MTVSTTTQKEYKTCNGSTVAFDFSFPIVDTSDIVVILRTVADGTETVLTETTHYVVSTENTDYSSGGTVTTVSTYASTYGLTLVRTTPQTQATDYVENDDFAAETHEAALDKLTRICNDLQEQINRCIKIPRTDAATDTAANAAAITTVDDSVNRASTYLKFDASGNVTVSAT